MTLDKFTIKAQEAIARSEQITREYGQQQIEPEHILRALLSDSEGVVVAVVKNTAFHWNRLRHGWNRKLIVSLKCPEIFRYI